jgi:light-regulated signal transduction histidine kinase (bacteriophytochrome)
LRNIRGFSDLLQKRDSGKLESESKRFLDIVSSEATRLNDLIGSLLAFSRLNRTVLKPAEVDLIELSRAVIEEFRSDFDGRQIEWVFGDLPKVSGDPTLLRQVLANLIGNALKFTRGRAPARIEIGFERADSEAGEVVYYVRDNGIGFVEAYAEKAFGVFQRLHSGTEFEGTGIGLAIVRRIISRHGGRVWAVGAPEEGATIYFSLRSD